MKEMKRQMVDLVIAVLNRVDSEADCSSLSFANVYIYLKTIGN